MSHPAGRYLDRKQDENNRASNMKRQYHRMTLVYSQKSNYWHLLCSSWMKYHLWQKIANICICQTTMQKLYFFASGWTDDN